MRLAGQEKGGFYPLPPVMNKYITSTISMNVANGSGKILDPGCGEGTALIDLASKLNLVPYGCELHEDRAYKAKDLVSTRYGDSAASRVIQDDMININTQRGAFHILYLNPPYDYDKESGREEYRWLKKLRPLLAPGGLLIWIIPERILSDKNVQKYVSSWFDDPVVYRFVHESYELFKQVVFYGIARKAAQRPSPFRLKALRQLSQLGQELPQHPLFTNPLYKIGGIRIPHKFWFRGLVPSIEVVKEELSNHGVRTRQDYITSLKPRPLVHLDPLIPLKIGHLASTIAAGHINNELIKATGGDVLIKGSVYTEPMISVSSEQVGKKTRTKTTTIKDPRSVITTISDKGEIETLRNERLANFLSNNLKIVTKKIQTLYPPRYRFKLKEWAGYLKGVNRRRIPNTNRIGLLPAQKHATAAINVHWEKHDAAILVGQLGTGKTIMAIAAAYAQYHKNNNRDHFLVMCPPHLVKKWIREIGLTWPKAKAMPLLKVTDVDRFFATEGPIFAVIKSTTAATGDGWSHRFWFAGPMGKKRPIKKGDQPVYYHMPAKVKDALEAPESDPDFFPKKAWLNKKRIKCSSCWEPVTVQDSKNKNAQLPASFSDFNGKQLFCQKCGQALWQDDRRGTNGRYPLATYIKRHYGAGQMIDIAIIDEAHQYKGEGSNRGHAYARIILSSKTYLAMTGTIYGGRVSTLFYLLFRLSKEFRRNWVDFTKEDRQRMMRKQWIDEYGVMQVTETSSEDTSSASTGTKSINRNENEVAGSSPAMLPWLLNRSVFVSLADMGMALPSYKEIVVEVDMDEEMTVQYNHLYSALSEALVARLVRGDRSMLSKYLYALLFFPDAAFRPKSVCEPKSDEPFVSVPGTGKPVGEHPKEAAILKLIKDELAEGRKCLLMVEQTSTLDIQPQWQDLFTRNMISSAILRVDPNKREAWIHKQGKIGTQVLISHPRRVETGLDILDYPTIIWMAPNFSIYTVMQASGRAYRLGQDKDCKVYFFAYRNTLQYQALQLVITKAAAAKRVNGDVIASDDLADLDSRAAGSIESALCKMIADGVQSDTRMTKINLDYEQVNDDIFTGHFADCATPKEAKKLYHTLAKGAHPDVTEDVKIISLADQFAKVNEAFAQESAYLGEESIRDDDDPEFVDEQPDPEPAPVAEPEKFVTNIVEDGKLVPIEPIIVERLVFGATIKVTRKTRRKAKKPSVAQLSLF